MMAYRDVDVTWRAAPGFIMGRYRTGFGDRALPHRNLFVHYSAQESTMQSLVVIYLFMMARRNVNVMWCYRSAGFYNRALQHRN
jgi:hypothetical protein